MIRCFLSVGLCALVWLVAALQASAQTIPDYDPSYIPSQFRMTAYPKCGFRAAADPSWPKTHRSYVDSNGKQADEYAHLLGPDFWKRDTRLGARFSSNPHVRINVTCNDSKLRRKFFDGMVQDLYGQARKARGEKWGKLTVIEVPGLGPVSYYLGSRKADGIMDVARIFFQHKARIVSLHIQISRLPGKDLRSRKLKAGKVVELVNNDGTVYRFRVTRPATQGILGAVGYIRSQAENQALFLTILKSLKPM